jgi:hypothetical protein
MQWTVQGILRFLIGHNSVMKIFTSKVKTIEIPLQIRKSFPMFVRFKQIFTFGTVMSSGSFWIDSVDSDFFFFSVFHAACIVSVWG